MSSARHTPGPWFVSTSVPTVFALHGSPARNRFSANLQAGRQDDAPLAELIANARLIAAAPDLLEALEGLCRNFPPDGDLVEAGWARVDIDAACDAYDKARSALARATGDAS